MPVTVPPDTLGSGKSSEASVTQLEGLLVVSSFVLSAPGESNAPNNNFGVPSDPVIKAFANFSTIAHLVASVQGAAQSPIAEKSVSGTLPPQLTGQPPCARLCENRLVCEGPVRIERVDSEIWKASDCRATLVAMRISRKVLCIAITATSESTTRNTSPMNSAMPRWRWKWLRDRNIVFYPFVSRMRLRTCTTAVICARVNCCGELPSCPIA